MEPDGWLLTVGHRGVPGVDGVGLAFYQSPVDRADFVFLENGQAALKSTVAGAGHVLGADQRAAEPLLQVDDLRFQLGGFVVVVEGDDVRLRKHQVVGQFVVVPPAGGDRLRRAGGLRPSTLR